MSYEKESASAAGHFTAVPSEVYAKRMELDSYLMMHANRSLPLVQRSSLSEHQHVNDSMRALLKHPRTGTIGRTVTGFAAGELAVEHDGLLLRASNSLNNLDTVYRFSVDMTTFTAERFAIPRELAATPLLAIEIDNVSDGMDMRESPKSVLSVLRASSMLCQFVAGNR